MVAPTPSRLADWRFESRLPWPGVRGRRLWHHVTSGEAADANDHAEEEDEEPDNDDDDDEPLGATRRLAAVRYEVEMCESTAGHIALVLLRRDASSDTADASGPTAASSPSVAAVAAAAAAQLAIPRVLYVVDAVPPKRASAASAPAAGVSGRVSLPLKRHSHVEPRWTMLSADARAHSFGGAPSVSSASAEGVATPSLVFGSVPPQQQHVDELALVDELFTTTRATKDACILAKPPLLCARFDCRLIAVQFTRVEKASSAVSPSAASPLRCVVAREDGMCYIWEWSADLHTWSFLNRFCFLDNPNLKWTRPVLLFATSHCPAWDSPTRSTSSDAVETTELAWWSAETKDEPKLFVRKIQFGVEKNTFRTEIRIGSAFEVPNSQDVVALRVSPRGLWVVSSTSGVRLRAVATLRVLQLEWPVVWGDSNDTPTTSDCTTPLTCVHGVTSELLALHRGSGRIVVVSASEGRDGELALFRKPLLRVQREKEEDELAEQSIAAHRQLVLVLLAKRVDIYSAVSGDRLVSLPLPTAHWAVETPLELWTTSSSSSRAGASAVGLVGPRGYWQLRTPSGHTIAGLHRAAASPDAAVHALKFARPYGLTLSFDAARFALELLQSARSLVGPTKTAAWDSAVQSLSSPALLLATLSSRKQGLSPQSATPQLLDDMTELVAAIYRVTHEVLVTGRFGAAVEKRDDALLLRGLPFVTPANVEALHHLANWVLLAKRQLARLQSAIVHKGSRHARVRTVSSLSTFAEADDVLDDPAASMPALTSVDTHGSTNAAATSDAAAADADEASSSQLSRKLRPMTSLQFAAGSCSIRHGAHWLAQLETLLLPPVPAPPHALLFHEERTLADFQVALSSFSKHMYFESMARLYLLHAPTKLLAFVRTIGQFAPRLFTLSGTQDVVRSHAQRALTLLPPAECLIERVRREALAASTRSQMPAVRSGAKQRRKRVASMGNAVDVGDDGDGDSHALAKTTLMVYTELLCLCGHTLEACHVLLDANLYEECVSQLLVPTATTSGSGERAVHTAVFFALLEFCVAHRSAAQLEALLAQKPSHVDALLVLRALRQLLPLQMVSAASGNSAVSVGALRKVLLKLLREHGAATRATNVSRN